MSDLDQARALLNAAYDIDAEPLDRQGAQEDVEALVEQVRRRLAETAEG